MLDYRLYFLDDTGHFVGRPVELELPSDPDAIEAAQQYRDGRDMELWQRGRFVMIIPKSG